MTLHSLIAALLPRDHREQVLGDLQERGFRLGDIASAIPRVWASHLVRTVTAPAPQIARAADAAIRARTEQLARQGALAFWGVHVSIWTLYLPFRRGLPHLAVWQMVALTVAFALCAIPGYFAYLRRALPESTSLDQSREKLLSSYRYQIDYQVTLTKSMLYPPPAILLLWLFDWYKSWSIPNFLLLALPIAIVLATLAERRLSRLHRELTCLKSENLHP